MTTPTALRRVRGRTTWTATLHRCCAAAVAVVLLATLGVPLPAGAQSAGDLDAIDARIREAEARIAAIGQDEEVSLAAYEEADRRLGELRAELDARNAELAQAQAVLADREQVLATTTAQLGAAEQRLAETRIELERSRTQFAERLRESYIRGRPDPIAPVLGAGTVQELTQATRYLDAVVDANRRDVEQVDVLATQIRAGEEELERLRVRQDAERVAAQRERDRVGDLVRLQEAVVAEADAEADAQRARLQELEDDR